MEFDRKEIKVFICLLKSFCYFLLVFFKDLDEEVKMYIMLF